MQTAKLRSGGAPALDSVMTWSDAAGSEGQMRTRRGDAACRSGGFETRTAPKGGRLETLSVLVWMGGFYCGQEVT
ncbi:hypothetical protein V493_07997 [Pseudogymnoascus sp. VKM F-4281 (FW-2241)]|nr:hypothetical protein V493_07997 [Pseudogymnoascus sp. VKM F-4281 (FW-2241)]